MVFSVFHNIFGQKNYILPDLNKVTCNENPAQLFAGRENVLFSRLKGFVSQFELFTDFQMLRTFLFAQAAANTSGSVFVLLPGICADGRIVCLCVIRQLIDPVIIHQLEEKP